MPGPDDSTPHPGEQEPAQETERVSLKVVKHLQSLPRSIGNIPLAIVLVGLGLFGIHFFSPVIGHLPTLVVLGLVGAIAIIGPRLQQRSQHREECSVGMELPPPEPNARLNASGLPWELAPLALIENVSFEPVIVERTLFGSSSSDLLWGMPIVIALSIMVKSTASYIGGAIVSVACLLVLLIIWIVQRCRPTYYRIIPGRLDVMHFSPLSNRARVVDRWDLRDARISVRFERQMVELSTPTRTKTTIRLYGLSEPHSFVKALLMAAISTSATPTLPDDALLG